MTSNTISNLCVALSKYTLSQPMKFLVSFYSLCIASIIGFEVPGASNRLQVNQVFLILLNSIRC